MFDSERIRSGWQREVEAYNALLSGLDQTTAQQAVRPDGWSSQAIIAHVAAASRALIRLAGAGAAPTMTVVERDAWNDRRRDDDETRPLAEIAAYWQRASNEVTVALASVSADAAAQPAAIPWLPEVKTQGDALRVVVLHARMHRQEIEQGLKSMGDAAGHDA